MTKHAKATARGEQKPVGKEGGAGKKGKSQAEAESRAEEHRIPARRPGRNRADDRGFGPGARQRLGTIAWQVISTRIDVSAAMATSGKLGS